MRSRTWTVPALGLLLGGALACTTMVYEPRPEEAPAPPPPEVAPPPPAGDVGFFYDSLSPYGSWVVVAGYGQVWVPRVATWWRPYTEGHWALTDAGWTWVAVEPWGWAPYHYGRWYWDVEYGWAWVPGTVWAPAWVAWRSGGGHIGWAPLPPQVRWEGGAGFALRGGDFTAVIAPQSWCFVEERQITAPFVRDLVAPRARNVTYVNVTNDVTNYTVIDNRVVNNSVDVRRVEQVTQRPVPRYRIVDRDTPAALQGGRVQGDEIAMVRRVEAVRTGGGDRAVQNPRAEGVVPTPSRGTLTRTPPPADRGAETVDQVALRHRIEAQEQAAHEADARARLEKAQRDERARAQANASADQVRARELAERNALAAQQREEATVLAARHRRELDAARKVQAGKVPAAKPTPKPKRAEDDKH